MCSVHFGDGAVVTVSVSVTVTFVIAGCVDAVFKMQKLESGHSEMLGKNSYVSKYVSEMPFIVQDLT